ncbi:hypothetical protein [Larkinella sp.]|uniref:hypothetical protein n=1 Tax=Larkinella sp. TaxID=2034517 RepID=UPI003BABBAD2
MSINSFFLMICLFAVSVFNSHAQDSTFNYNSEMLKKWEVGINFLSVFEMPQEVASGIMVKRHFQTNKGIRALRLNIVPRIFYGSSSLTRPYNTTPSIYAAIGYEWQKHYGRFVPFYGGEIFTSYAVIKNAANGITIAKQTVFDIGGSGFIGAKYYATRSISFSIESHLRYTYNRVVLNSTGVSADNYLRRLTLLPIYALYLHYHF